jgi:4,5-DOPA dioxygenase extradiol
MTPPDSSPNGTMPAVFVGHGNPLNAIEENAYTHAWADLAAAMPRPQAILAVSAHWYVPGTRVTVNKHPRTIHDFGGFPRSLYEVSYPAPGAPELAGRVAALLAPTAVQLDADWGLDHGTWSVLVRMYPNADIPVIQLAVDRGLSPDEHFELARRLAPLRAEGVLLLGSGNVVHNLRLYAWDGRIVDPHDWAMRFESRMRAMIAARDYAGAIRYPSLGSDADLSVPTPDHFLPLLYVLAASDERDKVSFPVEGFEGGSISMLAVRLG